MAERSQEASTLLVETACRFCGLPVEDGEWHPACVHAVAEDDRPQPFRGHPMYGPRPGPYFIQQG